MWPHNHIHITKDAFKEARPKPCEEVINMIAAGNKDSDFCNEKKYAPQHFQVKIRGSLGWQPAIDFYRNNLDRAARVFAIHINNEKNVNNKVKKSFVPFSVGAYYILGRAFHCIQDFYAHTNYVALDRFSKRWDGKNMNPDIKLSIMTPGDRELKNLMYLNPIRTKEDSEGNLTIKKTILKKPSTKTRIRFWKKEDDRRNHFRLMQTMQLEHPDMQLDIKLSYPSLLIKDFSNGKKHGYTVAREWAKEHTKQAWEDFIKKVKEKGGKDTEIAKILKVKPPKADKSKLRTFFTVMKYEKELTKLFLKPSING